MRDVGRSDDPRVQAQLDRLGSLSIQRDKLGLDAVRELLARLGDPHKRLPPTFHVAGTNGKGSTCAFLRAMLEAQGYVVHTTISPHLVRYNERFRVAGKLIEDDRLAPLLEQVFDAAEGLGCSFFEITIAAAFTEFARVPADACVVEVGLGGRLDATNVLEPEVLAACGIAALGIDHERFLLAPEDGVPSDPMARIAFEKAGIAKPGVPLVTLPEQDYTPEAYDAIGDVALRVGAPLNDTSQYVQIGEDFARLLDCFDGEATIVPALPGAHQLSNAALAATMLLVQDRLRVDEQSIVEGASSATWPARLQRLSPGKLVNDRTVWLDGGHNPSAGEIIADFFDSPVHLVIGMLDNKDPQSVVGPMEDKLRSLTVVPVPNHDSHLPEAFGPNARAARDLEDAMLAIAGDDYPILIAGSLYLAGEALRLNDEIPG